jgi:proline racemase
VPSGRLACEARLDDEGKVEAVRFRNVPSFVLARDVTVRTSRGPITVDVAYGGAFYATLEAASVGLGLTRADLPQLIACSASSGLRSSGRSSRPSRRA